MVFETNDEDSLDKVRNEEVLKRAGTGMETNPRNKNKADEVSGTFDEKRCFGEYGIDRKD